MRRALPAYVVAVRQTRCIHSLRQWRNGSRGESQESLMGVLPRRFRRRGAKRPLPCGTARRRFPRTMRGRIRRGEARGAGARRCRVCFRFADDGMLRWFGSAPVESSFRVHSISTRPLPNTRGPARTPGCDNSEGLQRGIRNSSRGARIQDRRCATAGVRRGEALRRRRSRTWIQRRWALHKLTARAPAPPTSARISVGSSGESVQPVCARRGRAMTSIKVKAKTKILILICTVSSDFCRWRDSCAPTACVATSISISQAGLRSTSCARSL